MLVVDASSLIDLLLGQPTATAIDHEIRGRTLLAPELLDAEILNVLERLERGGTLATARADLAVQHLRQAPIRRIPHRDLVHDAWDLRHRLSAYNAFYLALARQLRCPVLTSDARWTRAGDLGVTVIVPGSD